MTTSDKDKRPQSGTYLMEMVGARYKVRFDAVVQRSHGFAAQVTDAPVEDGSVISDHLILAPRTLTLDAVMSDAPLDPTVAAAAKQSPQPRSVQAAGILEEWWQSGVLLKVVTRLRTYTDMVIERLEWTDSAEVGDALAVQLSFREVRRVSLQTVPIEKLAAAQADLAQGPVKRGRVAPKGPLQGHITSWAGAMKRMGIKVGGLLPISADPGTVEAP